MELGRSFIYKRAFANQEKGGKTWYVEKDLVVKANGERSSNLLYSGLRRPDALKLTRKLNEVHNA